MPTQPNARFEAALLNDAFDFSRYPIFKAKHANLSTMLAGMRPRRGPSVFSAHDQGSPCKAETSQPPSNVSEPQLISSTNYMRESWLTTFASARPAGDVANLSSDLDISEPVAVRTTVVYDTLAADEVHPPQPVCTDCETSYDEPVEPSDHKGEVDSLYSTDSAHQDAHPLLLSMPIIPKIKLERKATIRTDDTEPSSDVIPNQDFLSPRVRDLRTPARISSRRYGRILACPSTVVHSAPAAESKGRESLFLRASRIFSSINWRENPFKDTAYYMRSASEPMLNSSYASDGEKEPLLAKVVTDSPHSSMLSPDIDDVDSCDLLSTPNRILPKPAERNHKRSPISRSISFSSIFHAAADRCIPLDLLLRKSRIKPVSVKRTKSDEPPSNADEPSSKWTSKQGQIVIKVFVPTTDDIWKFRVPQDVGLGDFTSKVVAKLGFPVSFSGSLWDEPSYHFRTEERFKTWVEGRVRFGRNLPLVAHVPPPLPLVRLTVDGDGCEVWCYA